MKAITTLAIVAALAATSNAATTSVAPKAGGKVSGTVKYDGKAPETKPLAITDEKAKGCCPEGKKMDTTDQSLLISKDGGLANVVVTIDVPDAKVEVPKEAIDIDQKMCHFEPHVRVIPAGGKVAFLNSDQVSHNIHIYPNKNDPFNKTVAPGSKEEQVLAKGDKIAVKCDIHDWMSAWIYVAETPYYAITDASGAFAIEGLKPGKYKGEIWHEKLGKQKIEVTVKDDGSCDPLDLKLGEKKKAKS